MIAYVLDVMRNNIGLILAAVMAAARFRYTDKVYRPFIYFIWAGLLNEIVSIFTGKYFGSNVGNNNLYMLGELLLLSWLFRNWTGLLNKKRKYGLIAFAFTLVFICELCIEGLGQPFFYFNITACFFITLYATGRLATLLINDTQPLYKNAEFLICTGFILYFSYRIFTESVWYYGLEKSSVFRTRVFDNLNYINSFVNLLYLYAMLWMQRKPDYITYYG